MQRLYAGTAQMNWQAAAFVCKCMCSLCCEGMGILTLADTVRWKMCSENCTPAAAIFPSTICQLHTLLLELPARTLSAAYSC